MLIISILIRLIEAAMLKDNESTESLVIKEPIRIWVIQILSFITSASSKLT